MLIATLAAVCGTLSSSSSVHAAQTITFPFEDERFLQPGEKNGGLAWVPSTTAESGAPLVVFLHGTNDKGPVHRWFGGGAGVDLRTLLDELVVDGTIEPPIVAAPSQTRDAWTGSRLWNGFELASFVDAVSEKLPSGVTIDRSRIVLVGHSGAGCNPSGGLLGPAKGVGLLGVLAIDTCMDAKFGELLGAATDLAPVFVDWEPMWTREVDAFRSAFDAALAQKSTRKGRVTRHDLSGEEAHDAIVPLVLRKRLPELLPPREEEP